MTTTYTIPYLEPLTVYAGDTFTWTRDLSSYGITPTDWTLTYSLIPQTAGNQPISITASDNGDGTFLVNVLPATTADYEPDDYKWAAIVTNNTSGERQTLFVGDMKIYVNYATAVQQDLRSQAKQILDALEALFYGKALSKDQQSISVMGRSIIKLSMTEIIDAIDVYKDNYQAEVRKQNNAQKRPDASTVRVRFGNHSGGRYKFPWG